MLAKLFNELGAETLKEKIVLVLKFIVIIGGCFVFLKLLQIFMWLCYYAGVPM